LKALSQVENWEFEKLSLLVESMLSHNIDSPKNATEDMYSLENQGGIVQQILTSGLVELSQKTPVCLVLNNIHLAPPISWKFIHYLSLCMIKSRIMVLATLRQDGKKYIENEVPSYANTLERMNREGLVERINIKRFKRSEIKFLCKSLFPLSDFSGEIYSLLYKASNGVPSDTIQLVRYLLKQKYVYFENGIWFNKENISIEALLTQIRRDRQPNELAKQLKKLPPELKKILQIMALMEGSLDYRVLESFFEYSGIDILKKLQDLLENKWIISLPDETFQLKRSSLHQLILEVLPPRNRQSIHEKIAKSIENLEDYPSHRMVLDLAFHYGNTKRDDLAFKYYIEAASFSVSNFAYAEAREFYYQAISLIKKNDALADKKETITILLETAWINRILGNWEMGLIHCADARKLLANSPDAELLKRILIQEGFLKFNLRDYKESIRSFKQILNSNGKQNSFLNALANFGLGCNYFELCEFSKSADFYYNAHVISRANEYDKLMANSLNDLGVLKNILGDYIQAIATYSASIPVFKKLGDDKGLARVYHNIGMTHAEMNNWQEADKFYSQSLGLTDTLGLLPLKLINFLNRSRAKIQLNQPDLAEEYLIKAQRIMKKLDDKLAEAEYHKIRGIVEKHKKRYKSAEKHFNTAMDIFSQHQNKLGLAETEYEISRLAGVMGDETQQRKWLETACERYQQMGIASKVKKMKLEYGDIENLEFKAARAVSG
jgi:predicted ATPase